MTVTLMSSISPQEADTIRDLALKAASDGDPFVNIGVWKGHSTAILASIARLHGSCVYAIDHWKGNENTVLADEAQRDDIYNIFKSNMSQLNLWQHIRVVSEDSVEASKQFEDKSVIFVFIDADHRHIPFMADLKAWMPKVKKGGILCGHDCDAYYSKCSDEDKALIDNNLDIDYVRTYHAGVIKGLFDCFQDEYDLIKDTRIWYKEI